MRNLLSPDNRIMDFITKIVYSSYLNILWFFCCIPIITIGASTTALFYVTLKISKNEEGTITKAFFHAFRSNFVQATKVWLILLTAGCILAFDGYVFYHMRFSSVIWAIGTATFIVVLAAYVIIMMYIFPLLAKFEQSTGALFKNSIMMGVRFLFCTILMAVIYYIMALIVIRFFTPAIVFGEGSCALLCSYLLSNVFLSCQTKTNSSDEPTKV